MKEWALCGLGTFPRLGPHAGALHSLTMAFQEGRLLREPSYVVTSSVFSIPASVYISRDLREFQLLEKRLINLRKKQFVGLNPKLKKNAALDFMVMAGLLYSAYKAGKLSKDHPYIQAAAMASLLPSAYKLSEKAIRDIFTAPSFLTYDNLHNLLLSSLNFDKIFNSPIKIEIPAVNINKAGWGFNQILSDPPLFLNGWKNQGWVSVTNFKPEDINREEKDRNNNYVRKMINGMRIEGHFSAGTHDNNDAIFDTATLSNMPVHFAISNGYSNIVVLHYCSEAEGPTDRVFTKWTESMNRCGDIRVSENTRKTTLGYLRINNDLMQLKRLLDGLKRLEDMAVKPELSLENRNDLLSYVREQRDLLEKLSYFNKKIINFLFVGSEPIPDAHFSDFTKEQMIDGIAKGHRAGNSIVPTINKMISD